MHQMKCATKPDKEQNVNKVHNAIILMRGKIDWKIAEKLEEKGFKNIEMLALESRDNLTVSRWLVDRTASVYFLVDGTVRDRRELLDHLLELFPDPDIEDHCIKKSSKKAEITEKLANQLKRYC